MNRDYIKKAFKEYTDAYNSSDEKIRLKIEHTYCVADFSDQIAESLALSERDKDIAWTIAMLHDIGRFEQVKRYHTFFDAQSVNHAAFGADLLFVDGLMHHFQEESNKKVNNKKDSDKENCDKEDSNERDFTEEELRLIELAIRQHNAFRIEEGLTEREKMFCHIIRDADKIDILRINSQTPMQVIYGDTDELSQSLISPKVLQAFHDRSCVLKTDRQTAADNIVGQITLAFELVYPRSRQLVLELGHLEKILSFQSEHPMTAKHFQYMRKTMMNWLRES